MSAATNRWTIARRDLLRSLGLGVAALPILRAGRADAAPGERRLVIVVHTGGFRQALWRPRAGALADQTLPAGSVAVEPHKNDVIFLPDLGNPNHPGSAEAAYGTIFYGLPGRTGGAYPEPRGPTVDQVVAAALPGGRSRSLALQVQTDVAPLPSGRGGRRCFWTGANQPVDPEPDPAVVYQRLIAGITQAGPDAAVMRQLAERRSMLDRVGRSLTRFAARLGNQDRLAIQAHMQAVRDLEQELATPNPTSPLCPGMAPGASSAMDLQNPTLLPKLLDAQLRLTATALSCGVARVVTVQISNAIGGAVNFGLFVPGIPAMGSARWPDLNRNAVAGGVDMKALVDRYLMDRFAGFITLLKQVPDGPGTLLDSTAVLWGSHMMDGVTTPRRAAWMLAGSCGGHFRTGQCLLAEGKPLTGVLAELCTAMGVPGSPFGARMDGLARV